MDTIYDVWWCIACHEASPYRFESCLHCGSPQPHDEAAEIGGEG